MKYLLGFIAILAIMATGCNTSATFNYSTAAGTPPKFQEKNTAKKTVAVTLFLDQRGLKYANPAEHKDAISHPNGDSGSYAWGWLPLAPFGCVEKEEPEKSDNFVTLGHYYFKPQSDLANAAKVSLEESNLFSAVCITDEKNLTKTDYIFTGKILSTCYRGYVHTYLVTYFAAPVLWLIGFPYGSSKNELWLNFELVERATNKVVWTYEFREHEYKHHWIYSESGHDMDNYPKLMKEAMNKALFDLSQKMK